MPKSRFSRPTGPAADERPVAFLNKGLPLIEYEIARQLVSLMYPGDASMTAVVRQGPAGLELRYYRARRGALEAVIAPPGVDWAVASLVGDLLARFQDGPLPPGCCLTFEATPDGLCRIDAEILGGRQRRRRK